MPDNKLTPDALAIMAAIFMGNDDTSAEEALRYARDIEDELFRPPSPADLAAPPPEADRTVSLTLAEVQMLQRGLIEINEKVNPDERGPINRAWRGAWGKLYPLGAGV